MRDMRSSPEDADPDPESVAAAGRAFDSSSEGVDLGADEAGLAGEIVRRLSGRESSFGRYEVKAEIARGGQGAVLQVWDTDLRRDLAMKVIADSPSGEASRVRTDSMSLGRFLEEAQVTGQLDHPGIVPIHELGLDDDGRVYFTMKLVRGRELARIFGLVREAKEGWTVTRALGILLKVCEAMAYAHDKGVIHRDLKPANVMVGGYGAVYVMDWGLARVLDGEDHAPVPGASEPALRVQSERKEKAREEPLSALATMDGDVMGTPVYMSPEQARGDLDEVGPLTDVYAVGAMLYQLLAGQMPYVPSGEVPGFLEVWERVREGAPTPIEELAPEQPAELLAICRKAMEREVSRRYASMESLADDLRAFLEGRVVGAYEAGAWAEARKWMGRNRALAASLASGLILLVAGLVTAMILRRDAVENAELARERAAQLEEVAAFQAEQLGRIDPMQMGLGLRRALVAAVPEARRQGLTEALTDVNFTSLALGALRENVFGETVEAIDAQFTDQPLVQAALLQTVASTLRKLGLLDQAHGAQTRALSLRRDALGDGDPATLESLRELGQLELRRKQYAEAEAATREALEGVRRLPGMRQLELGLLFDLAHILRGRHRVDEAARLYGEAREGFAAILGQEHPAALAAAVGLAQCFTKVGDYSEAEELLRWLIEVQTRNHGEQHEDTLFSMGSLSVALREQGKYAEAERYDRRVLEGQRRVLGDDHPHTLSSIMSLSVVLHEQDKLTEAVALAREAVAGRGRLFGHESAETLAAINNLAGYLTEQGKYSEAESLLRQVLERYRGGESVSETRRINTLVALGNALHQQGKSVEAVACTQEALEGQSALYGDDHPYTLNSHYNLARQLEEGGRWREAVGHYRIAIEGLVGVLGRQHPSTREAIVNGDHALQLFVQSARSGGDPVALAEALGAHGALFLLQADHGQAEVVLAEASELLFMELPESDLRVWQVLSDLGAAIAGQGRREEAEPMLVESAGRMLESATARAASSETSVLVVDPEACVQRLVDFYEAWHVERPGEGHDASGLEWRKW